MMGATTGATPLTAPISASIRARSRPPNRSVATDREMTMPPEPAMPCRKRAVTNWRMSEAKMQSRVEPMKSHMAVSSGETDIAKLQASYDTGYAQAMHELPAIREFLGI